MSDFGSTPHQNICRNNRWDVREFRLKRRKTGALYDVLLKELREDNCPRVAKYFEQLVTVEHDLITLNQITVRISDDPHFLLMVFDNVHEVELLSKQYPKAKPKSLELLVQTINLVEAYKSKYSWLVPRFYEIVARIMHKVPMGDSQCFEIKAKFLFKYGSYLTSENRLPAVSINVLNEALLLTRDRGWKWEAFPIGIENTSLEEAIVRKLVLARLNYGHAMLSTLPQYSAASCDEALKTLLKDGFDRNKQQVLDAYVLKIEALLRCEDFKAALKDVITVEKYIIKEEPNKFAHTECVIARHRGFCYKGFKNYKSALEAFQKALDLSTIFKFHNLVAECSVEMAKIHAENQFGPEDYAKAREYLLNAADHLESSCDPNIVREIDEMLSNFGDWYYDEPELIMNTNESVEYYGFENYESYEVTTNHEDIPIDQENT